MRLESLLDALFPAVCAACDRTGSGLCERCRPGPEARERFALGGLPCLALGRYDGALLRAVLALKAGRRDVAAALGELLAGLAAEAALPGDALVPVPTTAPRRRARGFDQAVLLAATAGRIAGVPPAAALVRTGGPAQHGLGRALRLAAAGRFRAEPAALAGRRAVLVDDVATTGATLCEAAGVLEKAGARVAAAIVVARTHEAARNQP